MTQNLVKIKKEKRRSSSKRCLIATEKISWRYWSSKIAALLQTHKRCKTKQKKNSSNLLKLTKWKKLCKECKNRPKMRTTRGKRCQNLKCRGCKSVERCEKTFFNKKKKKSFFGVLIINHIKKIY